MFGIIEAGGTKMICAVGTKDLEIIDQERIQTNRPEETFDKIIEFFNKYSNKLKSIAVGSFGPINIDEKSKDYGKILNTPKDGWKDFNIYSYLKNEFDLPIYITTDVNASAYGEYTYGAGKDKKSLAYYTVGTGIGGGVIQDDLFIGGVSHPEMGHMIMKKHEDDSFSGVCPSHGDCLEGLASGPSIEKRFNKKAEDIDPDDKIFDIEAYYLAQCAHNTTLCFNPEVIVFGGGVMQVPGLIEKVRENFKKLMNEYIEIKNIDSYIVKPTFDGQSATLGLMKIAMNLVKDR